MQDKISTLFIGIDIHKETHTLVGTNVACESLCELTFKNDLSGFQKAFQTIQSVAENNNFKPIIGLEDSGGNGLSFAHFLSTKGMMVKTVNPVLVDRNRKYNTHPEKSDSQDALSISEVLVKKTNKLPDFTITQETEFSKKLVILVKDREYLVCEQTKLKNKLHLNLQNTWGIIYKKIYQKNIFGKRALKFWNKYPSIIDFKKTTKPLIEKPDWLKKTAVTDLPIVSDIEHQHIHRLLERLSIIQKQLKEIEKELENLVKEKHSYLLTLPGCGIITAAKLIAFVKDIQLFKNENKLAKFSGISPKKHESGNTKRDRCSTRGHSNLRNTFKTIALSQVGRRGNQKAKEYFRKKQKEGKSKKQALRCLTRQIVKIVYCMLKEKRPYY